MNLPDPVDLAVPAFILLVLVEMVVARLRDRRRYCPKDTLTSLGLGFGSSIAGVLSGGLFGTDVPAMKSFGQEPLVTSAFYLAIDPGQFMPVEEFRARVTRLIEMVKASERAKGVEEVYIAGEIEFRRKAERLRNGIPISGVVRDELRGLAADAGVPFDL